MYENFFTTKSQMYKLFTEDMLLNTPPSKHPPSIHFFLDDRWAIPKDGFIPQNFLGGGESQIQFSEGGGV